MMNGNDFWKMFTATGKIEFYNAYRALRDTEYGQEGKSHSDESGAVPRS